MNVSLTVRSMLRTNAFGLGLLLALVLLGGLPSQTLAIWIPQSEAESTTIPSVDGDGVYVEIFLGIGGAVAPHPSHIEGRTPDADLLSPRIDFPHPGQVVSIYSSLAEFFADTVVPPDDVRDLDPQRFILRDTALLKITDELDRFPATPEIDISIGIGCDDGHYLVVGNQYLGNSPDHAFTYYWYDLEFEGEGLYPLYFLFAANAVGVSGLELSWETSLGSEIVPQSHLYQGVPHGEREISFEEFPAGTIVTDQYRDLGVVFDVTSGDLQVTDAFPDEFVPVSGDRVFADPNDEPVDVGILELLFVVPETDTPAATDSFSCYVIDAEDIGATITAYDIEDQELYFGTYNEGGASQELVGIDVPGIHRIVFTLGSGADTSALDNFVFDSPTRTVYPDLQVTGIDPPCAGAEGQAFEVTWTVTNNGTDVASGTWTDLVLLSEDPVVGDDTFLATLNHTDDLVVGESYTSTEIVTLPEGILGEHWIVVITDATDRLDEDVNEANNIAVDDESFYSHTPDIVSLCAWTDVDYQGGGAGNWVIALDALSVHQTINGQPTYFVSDFDLAGSQFQGSFMVQSSAGDDDFIGFVFGFLGLGGSAVDEGYYLLSWKKGNQSETMGYAERGFKLMKIVGPGPNLWDSEPTPGQIEMLARYTYPAGAPDWQHGVEYDFFLTYQANGNIRVVVRRTDNGAEVWNTGLITDADPLGPGKVGFWNYSQPHAIYSSFTQAELEPPVAVVGGSYPVDASMPDVMLDATGSWDPDGELGGSDDIVSLQWDLGCDGVADDEGRTNLQEIIGFEELLAKGLALDADVSICLTVVDVDGMYGSDEGNIWYSNSVPKADADGPYGPVYPGAAAHLQGAVADDDLNAGVGEFLVVEWDVAPATQAGDVGDGFADQPVVDVPYETLLPFFRDYGETFYLNVADASGSVASSATTIELALPNLEATDLTAPTEGMTGQQVDVTWTVTNTSDVPTIGSWQDCVYLSDDDQIGNDTPLFPCLERPVDLDADEHYDRVGTVTILEVQEGDYWIVVLADDGDTVPETDESDNAAIAGPFPVYVPLCADLVPNNVETPERAAADSTMVVDWIVSNVGDGATDIPFWYDWVYLSRDETLDGSDRQLIPEFQNPSYLNADEWYAQAGEVNVPGDASGCYFVIVKTDARNDLAECDEDTNVAVSASTVCIDPEPLPDLIVLDDVDVEPDSPWSGEEITVTWTAKNDDLGDIPTGARWSNAVFLSGEFDGQQVWSWRGVVWTNGPLAAGETYFASKQVTLPAQYYGAFQICIALDGHEDVDESNESNNVGCSNEFTIQMPPPADLEITELLVPADGWSGQPVEVTWTVRNGSTDTTWVSAWNDRLILSRDADPDTPDDNVVLGTYRHYGALGFDEEYSRTENVTLPVDANGAYYLCIVTDADDEVYEWEWEDNNAACEPIGITLAPPNLDVTACAAQPLSLSVGGELTVDWTVENTGPGDTPNSSRADRLYLSVDMVIDGSDVVLADVTRDGVLISGDGYDANATVPLPLDVSGDTFYIIVFTDSGDDVYETSEADNTCVSNSFEILAPDLRPEECATLVDGVPVSTVPPGGEVTVEWTVFNDGPGDALAESWTDVIHLSDDGSLDEFDTELGRRVHIGPLANGDNYAESHVVTIPNDASGDQFYILVQVKGEGEVHEGPEGDANNVCATDPFATDLSNLRTTDCLVLADGEPPTSVPSGSDVDLSWTVINDGPGDALAVPWRDGIYLSDDDFWDVGDRLIGYVPHGTALPVGESYDEAATVSIPIDAIGPALRVIVVTNDQGDTLEADETDNACVTDPFEVVWGPADLAVTSVAASQGDPPGEAVDVSWMVENAGGPTPIEEWDDHIYLSADRWLDDLDTLVAVFPHAGVLGYGESYSRAESVDVPGGLYGMHYVIVKTDGGEALIESDEANNTGYADPLMAHGCDSDLVVVSVDAPATGISGQLMHVFWTGENQGDQPTNADAWNDAVYLSRDQHLDPNSDLYLGYLSHQAVLQPDERYTPEADMQIPHGATGRYYVLVATDVNNVVCESDETNSLGYDPESVDVILPPPADLVVIDIVMPAEGTLGEAVTMSWTVKNQGEFQAQGSWHDSVYLSADDVWDIGDKRIGKVQHVGPLDPDESYDPPESLTAPLPGVVPGDYYIIVRTDIHNEVRESDEGEESNVAASIDQISVDCWELILGVPDSSHELSTGTEHYFKIPAVPEREDLLITLDCADDSSVTELFVRHEAVPDRVHHDFAYSEAFAADHEIVVASAQAGTHFILARGANLPLGESAYTISAELLEFEIRGVSPTQAGNTSTVTMAISGAKFEEGMTAELIGSAQETIDAAIVTRVDSRLLMARFDLRNLPADTYDLVLENLGGETAAHPFVIQEGGEPALEVDISGPAVVRRGSLAVFNVAVTNSDTVDALDVLVQVGLTAGTPYQAEFDPQEPPQEWLIAEDTPNYVHINAIRPGETVDFELTVLATQDTQIAIGATSFPLAPEAPGGRLRDDDDGGLVTSLFINIVNAMWDEWQENGWAGTPEELAEYVAEILGSASTETVKGWLKGKIDDAVFAAAVGLIEPTPVVEALIMAGKEIYDNVKQTAEVLEALRRLTIMLKDLRTVLSLDPNEKIAPAGFGDPLFVRPGEDLRFTVRFENLPNASAPAQVVTITDQLDPSFDWRAFRLGTIAFGDTVVEVPENRAYYTTDIDLTDSLCVIVHIDAGIDIVNGSVQWTLTAIDPGTGEIPTDPMLGFLPPNNPETHSGEGYVAFLIRASSDVPTGTEVTNTATIVFDINEPIVTNEVFNAIDAGTPTSSVTGPAGEQPDLSFEVQWTGEDDEGGSGIASYSVYYRLGGGPYTPWITAPDTSAIFTDTRGGGTYDFYSVATDNVGNIEAPPEAPDTTVTIAVQVPFAPTVGTATATTIQLLDLGMANVGTVEHAVYMVEDGADGGYVGADGRLQVAERWLPLDDWAGVLVWQLTPETQYMIKAKARSPETEFGEAATVTTSIQGDADGDGLVTLGDVDLVQSALGSCYGTPEFDVRSDLNGDDCATFADLGIVLLNTRRGDYNRDGYVKLDDFAIFHTCVTGPASEGLSSECAQGDFDFDDDIDLADFGAFQRAFDADRP